MYELFQVSLKEDGQVYLHKSSSKFSDLNGLLEYLRCEKTFNNFYLKVIFHFSVYVFSNLIFKTPFSNFKSKRFIELTKVMHMAVGVGW